MTWSIPTTRERRKKKKKRKKKGGYKKEVEEQGRGEAKKQNRTCGTQARPEREKRENKIVQFGGTGERKSNIHAGRLSRSPLDSFPCAKTKDNNKKNRMLL